MPPLVIADYVCWPDIDIWLMYMLCDSPGLGVWLVCVSCMYDVVWRANLCICVEALLVHCCWMCVFCCVRRGALGVLICIVETWWPCCLCMHMVSVCGFRVVHVECMEADCLCPPCLFVFCDNVCLVVDCHIFKWVSWIIVCACWCVVFEFASFDDCGKQITYELFIVCCILPLFRLMYNCVFSMLLLNYVWLADCLVNVCRLDTYLVKYIGQMVSMCCLCIMPDCMIVVCVS